MNKTGLIIALCVAGIFGLLFAIYPQLDLTVAHWFYNNQTHRFALGPSGIPEYARRAAMWLAWAFALPAMIAPLAKLIWPRKPLIVPGRAVIFLLGTILLTAIVLPNVIFKEHWGRPRPVATKEFNGPHHFMPWWDPRGTNPHNGSFFSGEAATAFWTYAPAALAPPSVRPLAFLAATLFGLTTGLLRMAFGAHYASDVIAAGVAAFLVTWLMHGLIYRWNGTRLNDEPIEDSLASIGLKLRSGPFGGLVLGVVVVTAVRLVALKFSIVDLFPDEARYWAWAQAPAFGYYSKPPLIAWIIAAAGHICGSSEACVRAPAPLFYACTALVSYFIAAHLYGERAGIWTGMCMVLATGAVFSARIMSTDVPLLFFWAVALLAYVKMLDAPSGRWWILLGLAIGFGLLAKYAMIYFVPAALGASFVDSRARAQWRQPWIWCGLLLALLIVSPNLVWNATHDFATFRHTEGNIVGAGFGLDLLGALAFVASQFAVCGPIIFAVFLIALVRPSIFKLQPIDRVMIVFALLPLLLVTVVALFSNAKANWAAPSAVSMTILTAALLVRLNRPRWLQASVVIGLLLQITLIVTDAFADRVTVPLVQNSDIYRRTMGWKAMSTQVRRSAISTGARTVAADQNALLASLVYYLRHDKWPILAWPTASYPANQFEWDRPLNTSAAEPVLFVSQRLLPERLSDYYSGVELLPPIDSATGPHSTRRVFVYRLSGARRAITPLTGPLR